MIGSTDFVHPELAEEQVKLWVYLTSAKFNDANLTRDFANYEGNMIQDIKNYITAFSREGLKQLVEKNQSVALTLNGQKITLKHREHFYLDAKDSQ